MTLHRSTIDPYHPDRGQYECPACGRRSETAADGCPDCGESLWNLAVGRDR